MGFDDVVEVAKAAERCSAYSREYLIKNSVKKPVISSACPVIVRLIGMRFPYLCDNVTVSYTHLDVYKRQISSR